MKIADLLSSPPQREAVAIRRDPPGAKPLASSAFFKPLDNPKCESGPVKFAVVPDKKRKKQYYMSAAQKRHRRDHEAFESRVFNLTLDINNLRQEVTRLLEFRDLQVTRLLLHRIRTENELLKTVEAMIRGVKENNTAAPECRVSRTIKSQGKSTARGAVTRDGVYEFVTRLDKAHFSGVISSMQAVFAKDEESGAEAAAIRRVCGAGGCMIEVAGQFTFPFMHHLAMALFPHAAGDEMLLSRVIGLRMTCPIRFFLYFNAQRELVRQMAHADMLPALREARPKEIELLLNGDRFQEVHDT